ncbi:hypothetical protein D9M71_568030 [compost metagenome]
MFFEVRQRQAQRQATVLRGLAQGSGGFLAVAHQAGALAGAVQPPGEDGRAVGAPQRHAGLAQAALGGHRVEVHHQGLAFVTVLADELLRVLA